MGNVSIQRPDIAVRGRPWAGRSQHSRKIRPETARPPDPASGDVPHPERVRAMRPDLGLIRTHLASQACPRTHIRNMGG
jgi:hypothetical protein